MSVLESRDAGALSNAEEFLGDVKEVDRMIRESSDVPKMPALDNGLVPPYSTAKVKFEKFRQLRDARVLISDPFDLDGNTWQLSVYPFGQRDSKGLYASLFVELLDGYPQECQVYCRITVECVTGQKPDISRDCIVRTSLSESWGWKHYSFTSELQSGHYTGDDGSLTITVGIQPETYYVLWRWLKWDNERKRQRMLEIRSEIQSLRGK